MKLNLSNTVTDFLKSNAEQKYTARQIADWISETYPDECTQKIKKPKNKLKDQVSSKEEMDQLLIAILIAEIGSHKASIQKKTPQIKTTEGRPRKYYYTEQSDADEVEMFENNNDPQEGITWEDRRKYLFAYQGREKQKATTHS